MATEPFVIEWRPRPLQVDKAAANVLVNKNTLPVVAKALGFREPSAKQTTEYGPIYALDLLALLQHCLRSEPDHELNSIHEITSMYQQRHNLEIEYVHGAIFNMTMHVIQLQTGIESGIIMAISSIPKEQTDLMDWEFTRTPVVVTDLAVDLEQQFKKGKKKLTCNRDSEHQADQDAQVRHRGTALPPPPEAELGPTENTGQ